ncbi:hypothetical protein BH09BAC2_BH09BAC2_08760 [soil metagenome]
MIHIVFQEADIHALQKSFELDETLRGEVIQIKDDFAVGPLENIYSNEGIKSRKQWWRDVLAGGDYGGKVDSEEVNDQKTVADLIEKLNNDPEEKLWIWAAQNKHDVSGYYWLISQLKDYQGSIFILYLNNLPFINAKGNIFYPVNLYEISAREFVKAKRLAREITLSEFEVDPDEWAKLCAENKGVRLLEGGKKLIQKDYDYYDKELEKFISADWQKVNKLIHSFLSKSPEKTGDAFLLWRIKQLISEGKIDAQGELKNMKDFEVKSKVKQEVNIEDGI